MALTVIACTKAAPKLDGKPDKLRDGNGLLLNVMPSGKYWQYDYRFAGKRLTMSYGVFPEVTLAEAREAHAKAKALLRAGVDPMAAKKDAKRQREEDASNSFRALALDWHKMKSASLAASTAAKNMAQLENHVFPAIGNRPAAAITPMEMLAMLKRVPTPYNATRIREICGGVFRYGVIMGRCERNPAADLAGALPAPKATHRPALTTPREFGQFLRDLKAFNNADPLTLLATRLALLTFLRSKELREGRWDEVDFDGREWRIPAGRMKAGKGLSQAHVVPLSEAAMATLGDLKLVSGHTPLMFPNLTGKKDHMSENTIGQLLKRMGYKGRQTLHGFRASARSLLSETGRWSVPAMERQLDHAERNKVVAAYARSEHLAERVRMMEDWGRIVLELEAGAQVIQLHRAA